MGLVLKILIVEDNPGDYRLVEEMLRDSPEFEVRIGQAETLAEALGTLRELGPDVVLLDLQLPDSLGLETLRRMTAAAPLLPVIVMTGATDKELGIAAMKENAQDYLQKDGLNADLLARSIRYAVERKRMIRDLESSQRLLRTALEQYPDVFVIYDPDLRIRFINSRGLFISGRSEEEVLGRRDEEIFRQAPVYTAALRRARETRKCQTLEAGFEAPEGHVEVELRYIPILDEQGRLQQILGLTYDITDRKRVESLLRREKALVEQEIQVRTRELMDARTELENARRLSDIGLLAATVAHELRSPLGAIKLAAYNMEHRDHDPQMERHLRVITKKVGESNQIINNLLFYSRIRPPAYEHVQITALLEECLQAAQQLHPKVPVAIRRSYDPQHPQWVDGDPLQLKELFVNLLNNAYEAGAGRPGGSVGVELAETGGRLRVRIADNGVGIAADDLGQVPQPVFTTKAKGTGLGLAVANEIAHLHGGEIGIESAVGRGTTVTVSLPLIHKPAPEPVFRTAP